MNGLSMPASVPVSGPFESVVRLAQLVVLGLPSLQRGEPEHGFRPLVPVWCGVFATEAMPHAEISRWSRMVTDTRMPVAG
jgi:hypothetical protein